MKDFWCIVRERRSVRSFSSKEVPDEYIKKILKAAYVAPSGGNQKNWEFIVIRDKQKREGLREVVLKRIEEILLKMVSEKARREFKNYSKYFTFFGSAPVVIAVVMKPYDSLTARILKRYLGDEKYESMAGIQSVSAAIENMLLATTALGLGACWMTGPLIAKKDLQDVLDINPPNELVALVPIGFPKYKPRPNEFPESLKDFVIFLGQKGSGLKNQINLY